MNTYLPVPSFPESVAMLDDRRLGKQRSEVLNILRALTEPAPEDGKEHPAIKMWRGSEQTLIKFGMAVCFEWSSRDNTDNVLKKIVAFRTEFEPDTPEPEWLGDEKFHASHRSFLLRSQPTWYRQFWPDEPDDLAMIFPRSPERARQSTDIKQHDKLVQRAHKLKEKIELLKEDLHDACIKAGLDPDTMEPISEVEVDPELAAL